MGRGRVYDNSGLIGPIPWYQIYPLAMLPFVIYLALVSKHSVYVTPAKDIIGMSIQGQGKKAQSHLPFWIQHSFTGIPDSN